MRLNVQFGKCQFKTSPSFFLGIPQPRAPQMNKLPTTPARPSDLEVSQPTPKQRTNSVGTLLLVTGLGAGVLAVPKGQNRGAPVQMRYLW
jgi:hypothetical protein